MTSRIKKLMVLFIFPLFIFSFFTLDVDAARQVCSKSAESKMRAKAYKVEFSYELKFDSSGEAYFEISYANLQEGIEIHYGENVYKYDPENTSGTIKTLFQNTGATHQFDMYASYGYPCVGEKMYSKKVTLPKFNKYSQYDECIEYEEFALCHKWYKGNIENEEEFYDKLNEYILSLQVEEEKPVEEPEEKNIFEKFIDFYVKNLIITLPVTILLLVVILVVVIRKIIRRKKRVKIDI